MSVDTAQRMWSVSAPNIGLEDNFRTFTYSYQEAYTVTCSADATELEIVQAPGIPAAGSILAPFSNVYCRRARVNRVSPIMGIVYIDYEGKVGPNLDDPLNQPTKVDWDDVEVEGEVDEDFDGKPIVNTVGDRINGVMRPFADQIVTLRRNMLTFDSYVQARYRQATNSDTFLGWPPGTGRVIKYSGSNVFDPTIGYWEVTCQIQFRYPYRTTPDKAWYKRIRNEGFYKYVDVGGSKQRVRAVDANKEPVTQPVLLDADGYQIPIDTANAEDTVAYWKEFKMFDSLPFSGLGFGAL